MESFRQTVAKIWDGVPRKLKYVLLGLVLAQIDKKFPGVLPDVDPSWYLGGGLALATMHTVTDAAASVKGASDAK